jgi:hypothetical protein
MSTEVKQEGEFKIKTPTKPKNLGKKNEVTKIEIPKEGIESQVEVIPEVTKVEIKNEDAVQTQETDDSNAIIEESKDSSNSEKVVEEVRATDEGVESPLTVVEDTEEEQEVVKEQIQQPVVEQKQLPENIDKLVTFMEETGGTVQDYVRLNADYTNVDNKTLISEYYKQTKPHLDSEDVSLLLEDFDYDEDIDEPKDIRKKKIAFKEEAAKAKDFLEDLKSKYYDEIKLRPGVTQEQQKALDFFNRYNEEQQTVEQNKQAFVNQTSNLFSNDFKGFDFNVGEKKFRYGVKNPESVAEAQKDIANFVKTFLNDKGEVIKVKDYHKALYAARNADTIAQHFYEQGKADAVKEVMAKSKNISTEPRQTASEQLLVKYLLMGLKLKQ